MMCNLLMDRGVHVEFMSFYIVYSFQERQVEEKRKFVVVVPEEELLKRRYAMLERCFDRNTRRIPRRGY